MTAFEVAGLAESVITWLGGIMSIAAAVYALVAAKKSGLFRSLSVGSEGFEGSISLSKIAAEVGNERDKPFEAQALASYYNQALSRATVSFWFSLLFASIGFCMIIFAFATHTAGDAAGTAMKLVSGTIIDAISSLFFVQSTNAQKSMGEFFEKLRLDRLNAEARDMISEIEGVALRDQLRSQLVLKYSSIERLVASDIPVSQSPSGVPSGAPA